VGNLSRFRTPLINTYASGLFLVQMFPILLALTPLFIFFRTLGLVNTYWSVIVDVPRILRRHSP